MRIWGAFILAFLSSAAFSSSANLSFRGSVELSGTWQSAFTRDGSVSPPSEGWKDARVPGTTWGSGEGGSSYVWYRREFRVPAEWEGRRIFVKFGGVRFGAMLFLDGELVGSRVEGFTPWEVEITPRVSPGKSHRLLLRTQDWGATFADRFTLPQDVKGELRYAPVGKVLYPVGGHFYNFGIWDDVYLTSRPQANIERLAIETSVRKKRIAISGAVAGLARPMRIESEVLNDGTRVIKLPEVLTAADGAFKSAVAFPRPRYWSPEDPHLYILRITLLDPETGAIADIREERFGFRELWAEGPDFYFNGVKRHLLATSGWPSVEPLSQERVRTILEQVKAGNNIALRFHTQPWRKLWVDLADEVGVMVIMEAALWCDSGGAYAYRNPRFWENYREHLKGMVERDRNNASLVMWSLENELLHCGCEKFDPDSEAKLADLGRFVKSLDPGHLITYESDHDPGGVADVIGLHYPHELPDYTDYPDTCDWLNQEVLTGTGGETLGSRREAFKWNRRKPLYIGEYLWVPTMSGAPGTVFFGDQAYSNGKLYDLRAKEAAWVDQTIAYRRAGVSGLCPWTEFESDHARFPLDLNPEKNTLFQAQKRAYEPLAVFMRERDSRFYSGSVITRTFDVFNDTASSKNVELLWQLFGTPVKGSKKLRLPPGGHRVLEAKINCPAVESRTGIEFKVELLSAGKRVHGFTAEYSIFPRAPLKVPEGVEIVVLDPRLRWTRILRREGLSAKAAKVMREIPEDFDGILLIAPDALTPEMRRTEPPEAEIGGEREESIWLAGFIRKGGRVLVLEQTGLSRLPVGAGLVDRASTMTFPLDSDHPLLAGLEPDDLKFWHPGHYVTSKEIRRPAAGGGRAVTVSGGPLGIDQAPIVDMKLGTGRLLLIQALVGKKLATEPAARIILENALNLLVERVPAAETVALEPGKSFTKQIEILGLKCRTAGPALAPSDLSGADLLILDGKIDFRRSASAIRAFLKSPSKTVYWHAPDPGSFAEACRVLGIKGLTVEKTQGPVTLVRPNRPITAGIAREDLAFEGESRGPAWMGGKETDLTVLDSTLMPAVPAKDSIRLEAEEMGFDKSSGAAAERTKGVLEIFRNYEVTARLRLPRPGLYAVTLLAGGTAVNGRYPLVVVSANGRKVSQVSLGEGRIRPYTALAEFPGGEFTLSVAFANDAYEGPNEDRNLFLDAVIISRNPWTGEGVEFFTLPAALAEISALKGRLVVDCIRWDSNPANRLKGHRYASVLLGNLGASFDPPLAAVEWIQAGQFDKTVESPYFTISPDLISYNSGGAASAKFRCVKGGGYSVWIRGRSTPAKGVFGEALVALDGKNLGVVEVASESIEDYRLPAPVDLSPGEHVISVQFNNDFYAEPEDRNLYISAVGFSPVK